MEGTLLAADYSSASCSVLGGKWIADFRGSTKDKSDLVTMVGKLE